MAWSSAELRSADSCSWRYWVLSILGKRFLFPQTGGQRQINNYWQTLWLPSPNSTALFIFDGARWRQPRLFIKRELLKYSSCTLPKTLVLSNVGAVDVLNVDWWLIARWFCCKACFCISGGTWGMNEKLPLMVLCWHNYPIISHWGRVTHICIDKLTIIGSDNGLSPTWTAPSHYLNQCWNIVNWTLGNKIQLNFNWNSNIFIQENAYENVVCEMASICLGLNE